MLEDYIYAVIGILIVSFINLNGHLIVKNAVVSRYRRWRSLNELVSTRHKTMAMIFWVSFQMIYKSLYLSFLQYMNNSVKKLDKKTYEVSYIINGKMYKMIVNHDRGPCPILQVTDGEHEDMTDTVIPYLGPSNDWHNHKFNPKFFGKESMTFELANGEEKTFGEDVYFELD